MWVLIWSKKCRGCWQRSHGLFLVFHYEGDISIILDIPIVVLIRNQLAKNCATKGIFFRGCKHRTAEMFSNHSKSWCFPEIHTEASPWWGRQSRRVRSPQFWPSFLRAVGKSSSGADKAVGKPKEQPGPAAQCVSQWKTKRLLLWMPSKI